MGLFLLSHHFYAIEICLRLRVRVSHPGEFCPWVVQAHPEVRYLFSRKEDVDWWPQREGWEERYALLMGVESQRADVCAPAKDVEPAQC